ncbi:MAG TPA: cyanophycin synthetase [Chloroflexia bacterium]|nr:cyanophycin synthetase [Chloroflexia bacterium]
MQVSLAPEMLLRAGERLGVRVDLEPEFRYAGRITGPDGRHHYFRNTHFDLNGEGAAETARDKGYAAYFMALLGYPVPEGRTFFAPAMLRWAGATRDRDRAYEYARELGFPVIVKPNNGSQGRGVARVYTRRDLDRALAAIFARENVALVQRPVAGDDYRIVVLDASVVCAYRRTPLSVTGDGVRSIRELLARKHATYAESGRATTIPLGDFRIPMHLRRARLSLDAVPAGGKVVTLMDNANLSTGGEAQDVSADLHPKWAILAVTLTREMGLRYCGVDIISTDPIDSPPAEYVVLEINPAPGLDHFVHLGPQQTAIVARMYEQILQALIRPPEQDRHAPAP